VLGHLGGISHYKNPDNETHIKEHKSINPNFPNAAAAREVVKKLTDELAQKQ
jgi:hypothetical protein